MSRAGILVLATAALLAPPSWSAKSIALAGSPRPRRIESMGDEADEIRRPVWAEWHAALPKKIPLFGVSAAWLDAKHKSVACVLFRHKGDSLSLGDYTNAYLAILDKSAKGYACRQFLRIWHTKAPVIGPRSAHCQAAAFRQRHEYYGRVDFHSLDLDANGRADLLVNLICVGGSYAGAEIVLLRNTGRSYSVVLNQPSAESQRFSMEDEECQSRIADVDGDRIPEVFLWHEMSPDGYGAHANARDWLDIYHWNGRKMILCNRRFPAAFAQAKKGFLEECGRNPGEAFEFWYCAGRIAEYEHRPGEAARYYAKCRACKVCTAEYRAAAARALKRIRGAKAKK